MGCGTSCKNVFIFSREKAILIFSLLKNFIFSLQFIKWKITYLKALAEEMFLEGYKNIINTDFSNITIEIMKERY